MNVLKKAILNLLPTGWQYRIRSLKSKGCAKGRDVYIHPSVQMLGQAHVSIGDNSCISEQTWLNVNHRVAGEVAIRIEDNCFIGRRNFFSSGKEIFIGPYVLTTVDCKFVSSSHVTENPLVPYIAAGTTSHQSIRVGANCFFGTGSMVLGNVSIGHGSVIGAGCLLTRDVPPFSIVAGNPARILKRYSFLKQEWIDNDAITAEDLNANPDEQAYLERIRQSHPGLPMPLIVTGTDWGNL